MSEQETARAVEQIQEVPASQELAELQAFIEAQSRGNTEGTIHEILTNMQDKTHKLHYFREPRCDACHYHLREPGL